MVVTNRRVMGRIPNTTLHGTIPLGFNQFSYPLANVAGVGFGRAYSVAAFLIGAILILAGLANFSSPGGTAGGGLVLLILGILGILAAFKNYVQIMNSGGGNTDHLVSFLDRAAAEAFIQQVNTIIATHAHQPVIVTPGNPPRGPSVSEALSELQLLRDQGHVTSEEYEAKRNEIVSRM
jgi:membrane-bound ClpP family serine protease